MKLHNFLILAVALAILGNGCINYSSKTTEVNDPGFDTAAMETENDRDPYGKAEKAFNDLDVEPSGKLDPNQSEYSMADRLSWYEKLQWSKECEADYRLSSDKEAGGLAFYKINDQTYLLRANCYLAAYQKGMIFMLVSVNGKNISGGQLEEQIYDPQTKTVKINTENDGQFLGFDSFDTKNKTLTIYTKGRGIGDCGSRDTYRLKNTDLELIKTVAMSCEDADAFHLKNPNAEEMPTWPVIYEKK